MELVALNEEYAAYTGKPVERSGNLRETLNALLAVDSWGKLVDFLRSDPCLSILPAAEYTPLSGCREPAPIPGRERLRLEGSLERLIERDADLDVLDGLARDDLVGDPTLQEVWIPEVLDFIDEARKLLTLAAVALGSDAPRDLCARYVSTPIRVDGPPDDLPTDPGEGGEIRCEAIRPAYVPDARLLLGDRPLVSPFWDTMTLGYMEITAPELGPREREDLDDWARSAANPQYPEARLAVADINESPWEAGDPLPEPGNYRTDELAGDLAAYFLNNEIDTLPGWPYSHHFREDPSLLGRRVRYDRAEGFRRPEKDLAFRWVRALWKVAIDAIYDGRVTLCEFCHAPIVSKSRSRKPDYCCTSHKVRASQRRRERAIALCASGVPLEYAVDVIGTKYRKSVEKWYAEAQDLAKTSEGHES